MPVDLRSLCVPAATAVVTSEAQRGVIGDLARLPELAAVASAGPVDAMATVVAAARDAGVQVVHCTAHRRADGLGANTNARLFGAMAKLEAMTPGSPATEVLPAIGTDERDIVLSRMHGLSPMAGTDLDAVLRNLGVTTVVVVGVSVNVAVTNLVFDAVNKGYRVVVPRDAVAGVPAEYADAVIDTTLRLCATVVTSTELVDAWRA